MPTRRLALTAAAALAAMPVLALAQAATPRPVKVVYHLAEGKAQATRAIANIRYHLAADPKAKIVVVTHGAGIEFLIDGAVNAQSQPYAGSVADLANMGVEFRVCKNTLDVMQIGADRLMMEASVVPSGVAEVARLQAHEGFVYLRP